jgi:hypothetical protein
LGERICDPSLESDALFRIAASTATGCLPADPTNGSSSTATAPENVQYAVYILVRRKDL